MFLFGFYETEFTGMNFNYDWLHPFCDSEAVHNRSEYWTAWAWRYGMGAYASPRKFAQFAVLTS